MPRKKVSTVTSEVDTFGDFNLRYDYEVKDEKLIRLTCNASPVPVEGQPVQGNVFFHHHPGSPKPTVSFNQVDIDKNLSDHVTAELQDIVAENTVVVEPNEPE